MLGEQSEVLGGRSTRCTLGNRNGVDVKVRGKAHRAGNASPGHSQPESVSARKNKASSD